MCTAAAAERGENLNLLNNLTKSFCVCALFEGGGSVDNRIFAYAALVQYMITNVKRLNAPAITAVNIFPLLRADIKQLAMARSKMNLNWKFCPHSGFPLTLLYSLSQIAQKKLHLAARGGGKKIKNLITKQQKKRCRKFVFVVVADVVVVFCATLTSCVQFSQYQNGSELCIIIVDVVALCRNVTSIHSVQYCCVIDFKAVFMCSLRISCHYCSVMY